MREHALAGVLCAVRDGAPQPARGQHPQDNPRSTRTQHPPLELALTLKRLDQPPPWPPLHHPIRALCPFHWPWPPLAPWGRWPHGSPGGSSQGCSGGVGALVAPHRPTTRTEREPARPAAPMAAPSPVATALDTKCRPAPVLAPTPVHLLWFSPSPSKRAAQAPGLRHRALNPWERTSQKNGTGSPGRR